MTFREAMERDGFDLISAQTLFRCILSAMKRQLSAEQREWLLDDRRRSELFVEVMER